MSITLVPIAPASRALANRLIAQRWGSTEMILRGQRYDMIRVDGLFAMDGAEAVGLVTFRRHGDGYGDHVPGQPAGGPGHWHCAGGGRHRPRPSIRLRPGDPYHNV